MHERFYRRRKPSKFQPGIVKIRKSQFSTKIFVRKLDLTKLTPADKVTYKLVASFSLKKAKLRVKKNINFNFKAINLLVTLPAGVKRWIFPHRRFILEYNSSVSTCRLDSNR